jgi:hypothetical protein
MKFEVGDMIILVDDCCVDTFFEIGEKGTIINIEEDSEMPYLVNFQEKEGRTQWCCDNCIDFNRVELSDD